ncbi:MAG: ThiF family adenylyltransferase [Pseudomonadota bacterium]
MPVTSGARSLLRTKTVAIVGLGGLGSPLALVLAQAGVGQLILIDDDYVDISNLQRQILYRTVDAGEPKAPAAMAALERRGFAGSRIRVVRARLDRATAVEVLRAADVVCDASDNFETKFLVNDLSLTLRVPIAIAAVRERAGQVFPVRPRVDACYRCLFETPPPDRAAAIGAGALGPACGQIAAQHARVAATLATGEDQRGILGSIWLAEDGIWRAIRVNRRPGCPCAGGGPQSLAASDRDGGSQSPGGGESRSGSESRIGDSGRPEGSFLPFGHISADTDSCASSLTPLQMKRYTRHLTFPGIGEAGQVRLMRARVAITRASCAGAVAIAYLAAAGVGTIVVSDRSSVASGDTFLFEASDVGRPIVDAVRDRVLAINPEVVVASNGDTQYQLDVGTDFGVAARDAIDTAADDFAAIAALNAGATAAAKLIDRITADYGQITAKLRLVRGES